MNITPENTILLFDLHQVLFSRDYPGIIKAMIQNIDLIRLVRPSIVYKTLSLLYTKGSGQELLIFIKKHHPYLADTATGIVSIANQQKPIEPMHTLIKDLKKKGYELHIGSNIGATFFQDLEKSYADFFLLFDHIKIVSAQPPIIRKPMPEFFSSYQQEANPQHKHIIFIDDNRMHIAAAKQAGFSTILFKNATQLKNEFTQYGIL